MILSFENVVKQKMELSLDVNPCPSNLFSDESETVLLNSNVIHNHKAIVDMRY